MHRKSIRTTCGFSLVELLIVVVLLTVLAAMILPSFLQTTDDIDKKLAIHNLGVFRALVVRYRGQHGGRSPSPSMAELLFSTNGDGDMGTGPEFRFGPYLAQIPGNPITHSTKVTAINVDEPTLAHVTGGGWLYNPQSGKLWLDHADYLIW